MASGDHDWTAGEQVTAANVDDYLMLQALQKFATSAARDTALSARKREGMHTYQDDSNCDTVYSGAAWSTIGPVHGALTTYTPTLTQSGAVTKTVDYASYQRIGRMILGSFRLNVTGAGTAANAITISTPVTALSTTAVVGAGYWFDTGTQMNVGALTLASTTTFVIYTFVAVATLPAIGATGSGDALALASGDFVSGNFMYEAAADA